MGDIDRIHRIVPAAEPTHAPGRVVGTGDRREQRRQEHPAEHREDTIELRQDAEELAAQHDAPQSGGWDDEGHLDIAV